MSAKIRSVGQATMQRPPSEKLQPSNAQRLKNTLFVALVFTILWAIIATLADRSMFSNSSFLPQSSAIPAEVSDKVDDIAGKITLPVGSEVFRQRSISRISDPSKQVKEVHAASFTSLGENSLFATWYGGTREGARDVQLYSSTFKNNQWSEPVSIMSPSTLAKDTKRTIKKLGTPVAIVDQNNKLWVFFVSVSLGGWAGSSINAITSTDQGVTFSPARRLITSPFLNISTLTRSPPFLYTNGDIGLPVYHEFIGKFSEVLRLSPKGTVLNKQRLSIGDRALQPGIAVYSPKRASMWQRNGDRDEARILISHTDDGGQTWTKTIPTVLPNSDSGIASIALKGAAEGHTYPTLLIFNNSTTERHILSMAYSEDHGQSFTPLFDVENGQAGLDRFSYPQMLQDPNGLFHLLYTDNRTTIEHLTFNRIWLNQRFRAAELPRLENIPPPGQGQGQGQVSQYQPEKSHWLIPYWLHAAPFFFVIWGTLCIVFRTQRFLIVSANAKNRLSHMLSLGLTIALLALPIKEIPLAQHLRGIFGDLSAGSWIISGFFCWRALTGGPAAKPLRRQFSLFLASMGIALYPMALGYGYFDPYALGFAGKESVLLLLGILFALALLIRQNWLVFSWLTLSMLLFNMKAFESTNMWDYLIDPIAWLTCLVFFGKELIPWVRQIAQSHEPFNHTRKATGL